MRIFVSGATKTMRSLASKYPDVLGVLHTPVAGHDLNSIYRMGIPVSADNAAFSGFDGSKFYRMISSLLDRKIEWCVCPDVVCDHKKTLELFEAWEPLLRYFKHPIAFVLQNGCIHPNDIPWHRIRCVFIGGDDEYKLSNNVRHIVKFAKDRGFLAHMGRVNSYQRMHYAHLIGCDSIDGTSASKFPDTYIEKYAIRARELNSGLRGKDSVPLFEGVEL